MSILGRLRERRAARRQAPVYAVTTLAAPSAPRRTATRAQTAAQAAGRALADGLGSSPAVRLALLLTALAAGALITLAALGVARTIRTA